MRDPVVPDDCPQEVADVIAACTQRNADARPSAKEVCRWVPHSCGDGPQLLKPVGMPYPSCSILVCHVSICSAAPISRHQCPVTASEGGAPCAACRMLYRATPAWEEPTEVREMLDAFDELDVIPEDAVRPL